MGEPAFISQEQREKLQKAYHNIKVVHDSLTIDHEEKAALYTALDSLARAIRVEGLYISNGNQF